MYKNNFSIICKFIIVFHFISQILIGSFQRFHDPGSLEQIKIHYVNEGEPVATNLWIYVREHSIDGYIWCERLLDENGKNRDRIVFQLPLYEQCPFASWLREQQGISKLEQRKPFEFKVSALGRKSYYC